MNIRDCKRILIVGDSGRGKSTLAKRLSEELGIKHIELDDIFWEKKFTVKRSKEVMHSMVQDVLDSNYEWVIEGSTRSMVSMCMEGADCIIHLRFRFLLEQWFVVIRRGIKRGESLRENLYLCKHLFDKRFGLGNSKGKKSVKEIVSEYDDKVIELFSYKEIDGLL